MNNSRLNLLPDARVRIDAPAKLNLGLRVFPPRPDKWGGGFHPIETWMVPTSWHDTLTYIPGPDPLKLLITGRSEGVPTDLEKNLVGKAATKLAAHANIPPTGTLELHKLLPPGGGLGGGSSDASAALVALNHAWNLHLPDTTLEQIAGELGSDVPFFIKTQPALCTGRGEIMTPLHPQKALFAVLILPAQGCPTKDVYQAFDRLLTPDSPIPPTNWPRLAAMSAEQLNTALLNDLEPAAFQVAPWLKNLRDQAATAADQPILMTGSGSTLFTLANSSVKAESLKHDLERALPPEISIIPVRIS